MSRPARPCRLHLLVRSAASILTASAVPLVLPGCDALGTDPDPGASQITELPRQLSSSEREVIRASNRFAFDLAGRITAPDSSFSVSPLSASMALGMAMNGAEGETYRQMRSTLGFGELAREEINDSYAGLIELLLGLDPRVEMALGNSIWYDEERMQVRDAFIETVREPFDAEVAGLDFSAPDAPDRINAWVREATGGRIDRIVPDPIPRLVAMYLINAIHFQGDWTTQFDPEKTSEAEFRRPDGTSVRVPMMERHAEEVLHHRSRDLQAVDLPYGGRAFSMTVLLPRSGAGDVEALISSLDAERWREIVDGLQASEVRLFLPRFELTWKRVLNDDLKALGMTDAFDKERADFSKLTPDPGVIIHDVRQKSFVRVDEEGTEAAAATSVGTGPTSAPPTFRADRPFLFAIRERLSGTILLLGKVVDPTG